MIYLTATIRRPSRGAVLAALALPITACASAPGSTHEDVIVTNIVADNLQLFAVLLRPGPNWKPGKPFAEQGLVDHFYFWKKLRDEGRVVSAGPLGTDGGLVLMKAIDAAAVDEVLAGDPAIVEGKFLATVKPYSPGLVNPTLLEPKAR